MSFPHETVKNGVDAVSIGVVVGSVTQFLPSIAAALSIIWTTIRILETRAIQRFFGKIRSLFK